MNSIETFRNEIDDILVRHLPEVTSPNHKAVVDGMKYSFTIGGKRIRPMLIYSGYSMCGGGRDDEDFDSVEVFMSALEMIHTYSLIHDDLPAMDDDDLRRGKPTCHKVYGEANAILAGDGLLNYAFELVLNHTLKKTTARPMDCKKWIKSMQILASHSGIYGMIGGQAADMLFETSKSQSKEDLDYIHHNKTGALIRAGLMIGGVLAECSEGELDKLATIGNHIGLSFQIQDDLLDKFSTEEVLGKPIGSDEKNNKMTYVRFVGEEQSRKDIDQLLGEAKTLSQSFKGDLAVIVELIDFLSTRKY